MRRQSLSDEITPTLWCKFDGNLNDSSPNGYTPVLLNNNDFSYYDNSAIIGGSNKCARYVYDKFANTGDFSVYIRILL